MRENCTSTDCLTSGTEEKRRERKEAEMGGDTALPSINKMRHDQLIEALPDAMVVVGRKGKIVQINAQMERLFGYAREELIGKNLETLMPERFRARHRGNVSDYLSRPRTRPMGSGLLLFGLKKDGTEFPVDISLSYVTVEEELLAMAAVRDITDRINAEHRIELNYQIQKAISSILKISLDSLPLEEQLNRVLEVILTIPSFATHSRASIYLVENEPETLVLKAMHGFSVAQVEACKTILLGKGLSGELASDCSIIVTGCLDNHREIEYSTSGTSGQYCVPIVFGEKTMGLIHVAVADGHKRAPEEEDFLSAIAHSLAALIERHQAEASKNQLKEQLAESEKFAALGRTTANVAHAIKNPLMPIGGFARRLYDKFSEGTREKKYAGLIFSEVIRVENILRNVLLFSRGKTEKMEECQLTELVERALKMYEEICREKSIIIQRAYAEVPAIAGNKEQLLQALENIISNAIDAMPVGGALTVTTVKERVGGASYSTVKITDTGQGISEENVSKIYEPFFTTKLLTKGTGLGLSITKKVVEDLGGFMHLDSKVGEGSTFSLYFPYKTESGRPLQS